MMKNWKSLFFKDEDESSYDDTFNSKKETNSKPTTDNFSFSVGKSDKAPQVNNTVYQKPILSNPFTSEVLDVYEKGLDSINMPGYDFFEFYRSVSIAEGLNNEQTYKMAFQMATVMDKTLTKEKLVSDADFYISKINEVHNDYITQGQQKLKIIDDKKREEKNRLSQEIEISTARINELRNEIQRLEKEISEKSIKLNGIDAENQANESTIKEKLAANDQAKTVISNMLNLVKDNIRKFINQ